MPALATMPDPSDQSAGFLFPTEVMAELTDEEKRGEFTLERIEQLKPEVIPLVIERRGVFWSQLRIAKWLKISPNTVAAIERKHAKTIEALRLSEVDLWKDASNQLIAEISENPGLVPWNVKALAASQIRDKAELLAGRATVRVEHAVVVDLQGQYQALRRRLVEKRLRPGQVREIGLVEGENLPLEGSGSAAGEAGTSSPGDGDQVDPPRQSDVESPVCGEVPEGTSDHVAPERSPTDQPGTVAGAPATPQRETPPGGGSNGAVGGIQRPNTSPTKFLPNGLSPSSEPNESA